MGQRVWPHVRLPGVLWDEFRKRRIRDFEGSRPLPRYIVMLVLWEKLCRVYESSFAMWRSPNTEICPLVRYPIGDKLLVCNDRIYSLLCEILVFIQARESSTECVVAPDVMPRSHFGRPVRAMPLRNAG